MKKALIIILAVVVVIVGAVIAKNQFYKFDEADFSQLILAHIQPDIDEYKEEYGWSDVDAQVDLSGITVVSERKNKYDATELDGAVKVKLYVKEVVQAVEAEEYTEELCRQIAATSFGLGQMDAQYYKGYDMPINDVFVDSDGNEYTAMFGYDDFLRLYKNEEVVFEKEMPKDKKTVAVNKDGKYRCSKCGSWVSHVTAKGYCSTCTDIYSNDWYIGLDGNVYVDRGY